jgi:CHAT domain-containing protein/TolA-binding protein
MERKPTRHVLYISIILVLILYSTAVFGESVEELIRQGDRFFNQEEYQKALKLYQNAYSRLQEETPGSPLLAEIMNNIAAVYMAQGHLNTFYQRFQYATTLKQQLVGKIPVRQTEGNLLVNGGFEEGLIFPWGTGHYERTDGKFQFGIWWNSMNAKAFMKIDTVEKYSGKQSLRITNYSPPEPHVFTTLSQRISGLEPNTVYRISCYVKTQDLSKNAVFFTVDPGWQKRHIRPPAGTSDWQFFSGTVNIGHNDYIDLRIVQENTGTIWLDDIVVEKVMAFEDLDPFQQAESLFDLAKYEEALNMYADLAQQYPDSWLPKTYIGRIYLILGKYDQAFEYLNQLANNEKIPLAPVYLGELYYQLGDYDTAEHLFKQSLEPLKGNQAAESLVMNNLSQCYLAKEDLENALDYQYASLYVFRHIGDQHGQALALNQLGVIYQRGKEYDSAQSQFLDAYKLVDRVGDEKLQSDIVFNLAETVYLDEQFDKARQYVSEVLHTKEAIHDQLGLVRALHLQGRLDATENNIATALESYRQAVTLLENVTSGVEDISREAKLTFIKQFSQLYREYVELLLKFYQDTGEATYHQEAFRASEQARSRIFTEMITEARAVQSFAATSADAEFSQLLKEERALNAKIHALTKQLQQARADAQPQKVHLYEQRLAEVRKQRQDIQARLIQDYPRYADLKNPKPLHITDIQELLAPDEAVLSYFVTPSRTAIWGISREEATCFVIPLSRKEILERSKRFYEVFSSIAKEIARFDPIFGTPDQRYRLRSAFARYSPELAHQLYQTLVAPAESIFQSKRVVYLTLDDLLYKLPFEALLTEPFSEEHERNSMMGALLKDAPFWVKTHTISYLPSLSVLRSLRTLGKEQPLGQLPFVAFADPLFTLSEEDSGVDDASPTSRTFTRSVFFRKLSTRTGEEEWGLPRLPDTRDEALEVANILGAPVEEDVYLEERASESNVKSLPLHQYRHVLFATHALLAGEFGPGTQPALALSFVGDQNNDGLLEMGEILGLDLNADLVVLSACNTASGSGKDDHGEGFAGLTRSFMYAGAKSLFVTQWSVESSSAKTLVQTTFTKAQETSKGEALALSKRTMVENGELIEFDADLSASLAHPYFWAPYILVGEAQ